jgi:antitoxin VapB
MVKDVAKVFMSGRSQAVRIPAVYRFDTSEVSIVRRGDSLVLTPRPRMTWSRFFAEYACPDFTLDRSAAQRGQERNLFA